MAKYFKLHQDIEDKFTKHIGSTGLERVVNITILGCENQKKLTKVSKNNPLNKFISGNDVAITINEFVFERLTDEQQSIVIEEAVACITFDYEKDKLNIKKPDVEAFSLILKKYGFDQLEILRESVKSIYDQKQNEQ